MFLLTLLLPIYFLIFLYLTFKFIYGLIFSSSAVTLLYNACLFLFLLFIFNLFHSGDIVLFHLLLSLFMNLPLGFFADQILSLFSVYGTQDYRNNAASSYRWDTWEVRPRNDVVHPLEDVNILPHFNLRPPWSSVRHGGIKPPK